MAFKKVLIAHGNDIFEAEIDSDVASEELLATLAGPEFLGLSDPNSYELVLHGLRIDTGVVIEVRRATGTGKVRGFKRASGS